MILQIKPKKKSRRKCVLVLDINRVEVWKHALHSVLDFCEKYCDCAGEIQQKIFQKKYGVDDDNVVIVKGGAGGLTLQAVFEKE